MSICLRTFVQLLRSLSRDYWGVDALPGEEAEITGEIGGKYKIKLSEERATTVTKDTVVDKDVRVFVRMVYPQKMVGYLAASVATGMFTGFLSIVHTESFYDKSLGKVNIKLDQVDLIESKAESYRVRHEY